LESSQKISNLFDHLGLEPKKMLQYLRERAGIQLSHSEKILPLLDCRKNDCTADSSEPSDLKEK
jgi:hypothetical protein